MNHSIALKDLVVKVSSCFPSTDIIKKKMLSAICNLITAGIRFFRWMSYFVSCLSNLKKKKKKTRKGSSPVLVQTCIVLQ